MGGKKCTSLPSHLCFRWSAYKYSGTLAIRPPVMQWSTSNDTWLWFRQASYRNNGSNTPVITREHTRSASYEGSRNWKCPRQLANQCPSCLSHCFPHPFVPCSSFSDDTPPLHTTSTCRWRLASAVSALHKALQVVQSHTSIFPAFLSFAVSHLQSFPFCHHLAHLHCRTPPLFLSAYLVDFPNSTSQSLLSLLVRNRRRALRCIFIFPSSPQHLENKRRRRRRQNNRRGGKKVQLQQPASLALPSASPCFCARQ